MEKEYWIQVENRQRAGGESSVLKTAAPCAYTQKEGAAYLLYEDESGKNTIILRRGKATLLRGGSRLELEEGARHACRYETGYGTLPLETEARQVAAQLTGAGGSVTLTYALWSRGALLSDNTVTITVTRQHTKTTV